MIEPGYHILYTMFVTVLIYPLFFLNNCQQKSLRRQVENVSFPYHYRKTDPVLCPKPGYNKVII